MKAFFSSKGDWIKTETKYTFNSLPSNVKDGFKKSKYAELTVSDVTQLDQKDKETQYKVVVKKNDYNKRNLMFSKAGQLISDSGSL
jgi:Putative beta-lactamase-inhibitor-like, PepSY-like